MAIVLPEPAVEDGKLYADCRLAGLSPDGVAARAVTESLERLVTVVRTTAMQRAKPRAADVPHEFICLKPVGLAWAGVVPANARPPATRMAVAARLVIFWMGRINPPVYGGTGIGANRIHF